MATVKVEQVALEHPGRLQVALTFVADHFSHVPGLKKLAAALEDEYVDVKHIFDEAAGELRIVFHIQTEEHEAHVAEQAKLAEEAQAERDRSASIVARQSEREAEIADRMKADAEKADRLQNPPSPSADDPNKLPGAPAGPVVMVDPVKEAPHQPSAEDLDKIAAEKQAQEATSSEKPALADALEDAPAEDKKPPSVN